MGFFKNFIYEIRKQLSNTPSFAPSSIEQKKKKPILTEDNISAQLTKAMAHKSPLILLIAPFGAGKTTHIRSFLHTHPELRFVYKSFVKVGQLDLAFLHLTSFASRIFFITLSFVVAALGATLIPKIGEMPFLLAFSYFFAKNLPSLGYIFHEALDNLLKRSHKLVILEDLERSSLSSNDQWALLSNLWQFKRTYVVSLGYSPDGEKEKLKMLEYAMKLNGVIIEIPLKTHLNLEIIKQLDPTFPFHFPEKKKIDLEEWIALFTPRELQMIREQVDLKSSRSLLKASSTEERKQILYISTCLDILAKKIELTTSEFNFDESKREILLLENLSLSEGNQFILDSFVKSVDPQLGVKFVKKKSSLK